MDFHAYKAQTLEGKELDFSLFKGKKVMILNTASACGLTPQYALLQELYEKYKDKNFIILGFPSDDFAGQEPGTDAEIQTFCETHFGISFPLFSKRHVTGEHADPLFQWLSHSENSTAPQWNFHKYLIDEKGQFVGQLAPTTAPDAEEIINWIENHD